MNLSEWILRLFRRIRFAPGLRVDLSKSGANLSPSVWHVAPESVVIIIGSVGMILYLVGILAIGAAGETGEAMAGIGVGLSVLAAGAAYKAARLWQEATGVKADTVWSDEYSDPPESVGLIAAEEAIEKSGALNYAAARWTQVAAALSGAAVIAGGVGIWL